jgi:hypothetical protein
VCGTIPGHKGATYATLINTSVRIEENPVLVGSEPRRERVHVHSNGIRGSAKRVWRNFPIVDKWETTVKLLVLDPVIGELQIRQALNYVGVALGLGRYRPSRGGEFGTFAVESFKVKEIKND